MIQFRSDPDNFKSGSDPDYPTRFQRYYGYNLYPVVIVCKLNSLKYHIEVVWLYKVLGVYHTRNIESEVVDLRLFHRNVVARVQSIKR